MLRREIKRASTEGTSQPITRNYELKDLELVITVAQTGSFRSAARLIHTQTSTVSRRVRSLEDRLGASLFERSFSGVRLTNAGREFHDRARAGVAYLDGAVLSVAAAGRGGTGALSIGVSGSLSSKFIGNLIRRFRIDHPGVAFSLVEGNQHDNISALVDGSLDLAFILGRPMLVGLETEQMWSEDLVVAIAADDPRTKQERLPLTAFADDLFIVSSEALGPETHDFLIRSLSDLTFSPRVDRYRVGREGLMLMVGLGFGVSLVCASEARLDFPDVAFIAIAEHRIDFSISWSPKNDNPIVRRFLSLARLLAREEPRATDAS